MTYEWLIGYKDSEFKLQYITIESYGGILRAVEEFCQKGHKLSSICYIERKH